MASAVATACRRTEPGRVFAPAPLKATVRQTEQLQLGLVFLTPALPGAAAPPRILDSAAGFVTCVRCRRPSRPSRRDPPTLPTVPPPALHRKSAVATGVFREAASRAFSHLGVPSRGTTARSWTVDHAVAPDPTSCSARPWAAVRCPAVSLFGTVTTTASTPSPRRAATRPFLRTPHHLRPARHGHSQSVSEGRRPEADGEEAAKASSEEPATAEGKDEAEEEEEDEWAVNESVRVAGPNRDAPSTAPSASPNSGPRTTSGSGGPVTFDGTTAAPPANARGVQALAKVDEAPVGPAPELLAERQQKPAFTFPDLSNNGSGASQPALVAPAPSRPSPQHEVQAASHDKQAPAQVQAQSPPGTFASFPAPAQDEILSPSKSSAGLDLSGSLLVQQMLFSKAPDASSAPPGSPPPSETLPPPEDPPSGDPSTVPSASEGGAARDAPPATERNAADRGHAEDPDIPGVAAR